MSIINDALKKLQNEVSHTKKTSTPEENSAIAAKANIAAPPQPSAAELAGFTQNPQPQPEAVSATASPLLKKGKESRLVYILGTLCLMIGLFAPIVNKQSVIGMLLEQLPKKRLQETVTLSPAVATALPSQTPAPVAAAQPKESTLGTFFNNLTTASKPSDTYRGQIIVNGIMSRGNSNLALIDGQVYEEGEEVNGARIIKINTNNVVIIEDGIERTLKVMGQ